MRVDSRTYSEGQRGEIIENNMISPTYLETPLWIPRLAMAIGVAALMFSIVRTFLAHVRRFRALPEA